MDVKGLIREASQLDDCELRELQEAIAALVELRALGDSEPGIEEKRTLSPGRVGGSIERKMINGCGPYRYLRWWSGGKHKSAYLGKEKSGGNS